LVIGLEICGNFKNSMPPAEQRIPSGRDRKRTNFITATFVPAAQPDYPGFFVRPRTNQTEFVGIELSDVLGHCNLGDPNGGRGDR
jgi:hypothetical protein